jgi:hypothetical protein
MVAAVKSTNNVILKFNSYENTIYFVPYSLLGNGCDSAKAQDMENAILNTRPIPEDFKK